MKALHLAGQSLFWIAFGALIAALAQGPGFAPVPAGHGELKFSLAHLSERLVPCRQLTEEQRQALPPTRRVTEVCERGRVPTRLVVRLNDEVLIEQTISPAGWHDEGRAYWLERFSVPAGDYRLELTLRDTPRDTGYDMEHEFLLRLGEGDSALIEVGDGDVTLRKPGQT